MTFLELAEHVLMEEAKPLTANEIWNIALKKGYEKKLNSTGKTPWATLGAQMYVSSRDNPKSKFVRTDTRPKKFYLKSMEGKIDLNDKSIPDDMPSPLRTKINFLEKDLHKVLTHYASYHLHCYTKTINHSSSSKKEFGEWVHPDMVGCQFAMEDWKKEVYDFSGALGVRAIDLFSFELKRELNFGNLRESFFQCVSNSSWANNAYLVAARLSENEDFFDELSRLATSFGIGVIELDVEDPHSSEIVIPARYRKNLDWEAINKLAMNSDFKDFIETVKVDLTSKKIHKKEYNPIEDWENMKKNQ
ncbi:COG2958 family protein [Chitinophaga sp. 22620]|uniref:COG2958 family protein n=1 Tax=Chitinophaga sp. 22620 TaxID=3453952 RepID=UPI003F82E534